MHIHILGIGGTFMSALALLARDAGFTVTGCDAQCYSPVTDLLAAKDIAYIEGYENTELALSADCVIVGNAIKRGMPVLEAVLNAGKNYISGPQWLAENILPSYKVLAIAGTHGKTTTTSMLAFILDQAGLNPGFLIGGIASNFNTSACLGSGDWFVIEADEYDSAFFDKRPKLMHYRPEITILNNLEFDHADIYPNLEAIQKQFHYYLKTIPSKGLVIKPKEDKNLNRVISEGIFSNLEETSLNSAADWQAELVHQDGSAFNILHKGAQVAAVSWSLIGKFNVENALAAIAASSHVGVDPKIAAKALQSFAPVKRRLEIKAKVNDITIYDDFAHHPTAIAKTIGALKDSKRHKRILVVLELASYSMKTGMHAGALHQALNQSNKVFLLKPAHFDIQVVADSWNFDYAIFPDTSAIIEAIIAVMQPEDAVLIMSNKEFGNIHEELKRRMSANLEDFSRSPQ
jgi:UDP-N-acetylmuramate: L-alanyl-gamma-D-glutamyl-meso-diaminopimelate ligase